MAFSLCEKCERIVRIWIVKLKSKPGAPVRQWNETTKTWDQTWIGACYGKKEDAEAASVVAAAHSPEHIGKIVVSPFEVAASDAFLGLIRKKRDGKA